MKKVTDKNIFSCFLLRPSTRCLLMIKQLLQNQQNKREYITFGKLFRKFIKIDQKNSRKFKWLNDNGLVI